MKVSHTLLLLGATTHWQGTVVAGPSASVLVNPCLNATFADLPFCNTSLAINDRVSDIVGRMTLAEKIPNLGTVGAPIPSVGLPAYNWWEEASSGVHDNAKNTTKFAFPITTGMAFNRTLWQLTGRQIGHEARSVCRKELYSAQFLWLLITLNGRYVLEYVLES